MKLKILTANVAMGNTKADHPFPNLRFLFAFHNWRFIPFIFFKDSLSWVFDYGGRPNAKRFPYFKKHYDLSRTLEMIAKESPDVIILNELFYQFKDDLILKLKNLGFVSFSWGLSLHYEDATLTTLVASRLPTAEANELFMPQETRISGGCGAAFIRLENIPITILGCHTSLGIPVLFKKQIKAIIQFALQEQGSGRAIIISGDFNATKEAIEKEEDFVSLKLKTTTDRPTCPLCLPKIFRMGCDHIFVPYDWKVQSNRFIEFGSDHLAVSVCVEK